MKRLLFSIMTLNTIWSWTYAQDTKAASSANDNLKAFKKPDVTISFDTNEKGTKTPVVWGLDTAWPDEGNILRGTYFIGKEHLGVGRVSFQPSDLIGDDGQLSNGQQIALAERLRLIGLTGVKDIALNCDHEVLCDKEDDTNGWNDKAAQHRKNYVGKPLEWVKLFKATVNYCSEQGYNVVSIAPFNEADYSYWNQGSMADFKEVCRLMREDEFFDSIRISGGNTLNCDEASKWYNGLSPYIDEGNTHQLAGSFNSYAAFFQEVRDNGHYATADELHNVMEAMVGVEYGMQTGIWWGFDGRARGEYCKATSGERLAYGEDRGHWTAASVYRMPDGRIQAFGGTSERQANNSSYRIVSKNRMAYFDGYGPQYEYIMDLPGGTGYQVGQTNAERVLEIHTGEDVPLGPTSGTFIIMNKKSRKVMMPLDGNSSHGAQICQGTNKKKSYQHWNITPVNSRIGGDFSYFYISNVESGAQLDVLNWSLSNGSNIILYSGGGNNEQWYFQYAGDGYYYIISRHSGKYLEVAGGSTSNDVNIVQSAFSGDSRQLWRLLPIDANCDLIRPKAPTGLKAIPSESVIKLSWNANTETDMAGYAILRSTASQEEWNTIARNITDTVFIDNTVNDQETYIYKIKAIDTSCNRSTASNTISAKTTNKNSLVAAYRFESNLYDDTPNIMHCRHYGDATYVNGKSGEYCLSLDGTTDFIQLPTAIAHRNEMTISLWIQWLPGNKWQRIFDFGNGENQYMFLTANADNGMMRFAIKNEGEEQKMDICSLGTYTWKHITITIEADKIVAYVDGNERASSTDISIRPADFQPIFNYIGRSQFAADPLLKAKIDDLFIYNYALSADEVAELYHTGTTKIEEKLHSSSIINVRYYTLDGMSYDTPQSGINIVRTQYSDGSVNIEKQWMME